MSAVLVGRFEPESPEWHKAREGKLGGSEIAAVLGLSPWVSRYTLWHRKAGLIGEQEESQSMNWGKRLEAPIVQAWLEQHPEHDPQPGGTFQHEDREWQIANPDLLLDGALLEVKTADKYSGHEWGKSGTNIYPPYYRDQVQWYLDVFGLPVAHLVVLIGGNDLREYEIGYDPARAKFLREAGADFMESVAERVPPDLDGSSSTYEAVREMHPDIDSTGEVELSLEQWTNYLDTKQAEKDATAAFTLVKAELMEHMGSARYATFATDKVIRREARGERRPFLKEIPQPKEAAA